jgi:hypothetical protein
MIDVGRILCLRRLQRKQLRLLMLELLNNFIRRIALENQHKKIIGYRDLTAEEIEAMNKIKGLGTIVGKLIEELEYLPEVDKRWLAIAKTDLQKGFMFATRAIARPTSF